MKTIGEILRSERERANLTIKDIASATKIEFKYIKALEKNDFAALPPDTFTKGFIRNYAKVLGKNPDELIAIYRRDYGQTAKSKVWTLPVQPHRPKPIGPIVKPQILAIVLGVVAFFTYLGFQYRAVLIPPRLDIDAPKAQAVVTSPVSISGKTTPDSLVTIDKDTVVRPDQSGAFTFQLNLSPGDHKLEVSATNRFGRTHSLSIPITVVSGS